MPLRVIFLDAVGTLFGVRGSVGQIYGAIAADFGVAVAPSDLDRAFIQNFQAAKAPIFPGVALEDIPAYEFAWWRAIAQGTFDQLGSLEQFSDFELFFKTLYTHFATADPWFVYPEVPTVLARWQHQGIQLGVLSNFDSRLNLVLEAMGLDHFFSSVTCSTQVGAAKPEAAIFRAALSKHDCAPDRACHIGDSWKEDYQGAKAAGLHAIWLERPNSVLYNLPIH